MCISTINCVLGSRGRLRDAGYETQSRLGSKIEPNPERRVQPSPCKHLRLGSAHGFVNLITLYLLPQNPNLIKYTMYERWNGLKIPRMLSFSSTCEH